MKNKRDVIIEGLPFKVFIDVGTFRHLPKKSGIYIITTLFRSKRKIHYIGSTTNFSKRISGHSKKVEIKKYLKEGERVDFLFFEYNYYRANCIERMLIFKRNPPLNKRSTPDKWPESYGTFKFYSTWYNEEMVKINRRLKKILIDKLARSPLKAKVEWYPKPVNRERGSMSKKY